MSNPDAERSGHGPNVSPGEALSRFATFPDMGPAIWHSKAGFEDPVSLPPEVRNLVISCWMRMALANPVEFIQERLLLALKTLPSSEVDPHFAYVESGENLVENLKFENGVSVGPVAHAVIAYGRWGAWAGLGDFLPYLFGFATSAALVAWFVPNRIGYLIASAASVAGLCLPQILFAQGLGFRYYLVAANCAMWLTIVNLWLLRTQARDGTRRPANAPTVGGKELANRERQAVPKLARAPFVVSVLAPLSARPGDRGFVSPGLAPYASASNVPSSSVRSRPHLNRSPIGIDYIRANAQDGFASVTV